MMTAVEAQALMYASQAGKFDAEASKLHWEAAAAEAQAKAAELAAQQVANATARDTFRRECEEQGDIHHGVLRIVGDIDDELVGEAISAMTTWRRLNPGAVEYRVVITSNGGSIVDGIHLFDHIVALSSSGVRVTTVVSGVAASMAAILSQAGDERVIMPNASFMLHQATFGMMGQSFAIKDRAKWVEMLEERFLTIIAERCVLSVEELRERWDRTDWWLIGQDAMDLGLFDRLGGGEDLR